MKNISFADYSIDFYDSFLGIQKYKDQYFFPKEFQSVFLEAEIDSMKEFLHLIQTSSPALSLRLGCSESQLENIKHFFGEKHD